MWNNGGRAVILSHNILLMTYERIRNSSCETKPPRDTVGMLSKKNHSASNYSQIFMMTKTRVLGDGFACSCIPVILST